MTKLNIKKIAALGCAAAMLGSLTACGEKTTWGAVIDGVQIPAGVFIYYLDTANYEARQKLGEQTDTSADLSPEGAAAQSSETVTLPLYSSQIDGVDSKQWIYDRATELMQEYAAVEAKFDEYGLTLSDDDKQSAQVYLDQIWDYAGDYYTSMGVSENSYKSVFLNSSKRQKLFETIYSEGGEKAVSDDEIKTYLDENYALINYIDVELKDGEGNLLKSDGKAERMEMLNGYMERYNNGEDFDELNAEYVTYYENLKKAAEETAAAEEAANAETADDTAETTAEVSQSPAEAALPSDDEEVTDETSETETSTETEVSEDTEASEETTAPDEAVSETETSAAETTAADAQTTQVGTVESNMTVIEKADRTVPCADVANKVFDEMNKGDVQIIETADGEHYYLVVKLDILEDDEYFTTARASLLSEMKSDDFDGMVSEWTAAQTVEKNADSYKRYDPEKMFKS
ncbi:MAG: hypothetical protein MR546_07455 [Oscillospiraceae bacterium]|nr:hypothetical protein [Oscillospiraceae bacterium]